MLGVALAAPTPCVVPLAPAEPALISSRTQRGEACSARQPASGWIFCGACRCGRLLEASVAETGRPPVYLPAQAGDICAAARAAPTAVEAGEGAALPAHASWSEYFPWRGCLVGSWSDEQRRCYTAVLTWPATLVHGLRLLQVGVGRTRRRAGAGTAAGAGQARRQRYRGLW